MPSGTALNGRNACFELSERGFTMPPNQQYRARLSYWETILDRKHWVEYLQPAPVDIREMEEIFTKANSAVLKVVQDNAHAYLAEGKEPPAAIAGPVMNFADDVISGRIPVLRAGDYIAVRNFMKQQKL